MIKISVESSDVWGYALRNRDELIESEYLIAENPDFGISVYVTIDSYYPVIKIYAGDIMVAEEEVFSSFTCATTVEQVYDSYLKSYTTSTYSSNSAQEDEDADDGNNLDEIELIEDRELELDIAVEDFFRAISVDDDLDLSSDKAKDILNDCKEHFLEYIARKHNLRIYRPMYLDYDSNVEFELFPYENMAFDDETNPIYK